MQFRSAVLPAPFGPINAVTRSLSASSRTFRRTCNPPKCNDTLSISRIRSMRLVPSTNASVLFHVAIAAFALFLSTEIEFLHVAVLEQLIARTGKNNTAILENVAVIGDRQNADDI